MLTDLCSVADMCDVLESASKDKQYSVEEHSTFVVTRNMVAKLGRIRPHWKSLANVVPTPKESTDFRSELVESMRDDLPVHMARARSRAAEKEKKRLGKEKGKGKRGEIEESVRVLVEYVSSGDEE